MDFLTSVILSGIAWDGIKKFGSLTGSYIKSRLDRWIIDDFTCERIAEKINDMPDDYKKSNKFLEAAIDEDEEILDMLKSAKNSPSYAQDNSRGFFKDSSVVNGNGNNIKNVTNIYEAVPQLRCNDKLSDKYNDRNSLKRIIDTLLIENKQVFILYGPTEKNKQDIFSNKADIWREIAKDTIVPNNKRIVRLLENNKELLTEDELSIFIKFKIHAKGFEDNQNRLERRAEYPQFPIEIYTILK